MQFPDGFRTTDTSFDFFQKTLADQGVAAPNVCCVILETYQGGSAAFAPVEYMQKLRQWCDSNKALLICDEVQAGFGRTGTMWGFEHYGIVPDLSTWGKGISSSLPIAAVAGRADVMDAYRPGSMSSTHSGNPVCCAAALASLEVILDEGLVEKARLRGEQLHTRLHALAKKHPEIGNVAGKGMVAGATPVSNMAPPKSPTPIWPGTWWNAAGPKACSCSCRSASAARRSRFRRSSSPKKPWKKVWMCSKSRSPKY